MKGKLIELWKTYKDLFNRCVQSKEFNFDLQNQEYAALENVCHFIVDNSDGRLAFKDMMNLAIVYPAKFENIIYMGAIN